jgi:hypothetical protein
MVKRAGSRAVDYLRGISAAMTLRSPRRLNSGIPPLGTVISMSNDCSGGTAALFGGLSEVDRVSLVLDGGPFWLEELGVEGRETSVCSLDH